MKNIGVFVSENFQFLEMKISIYLNRSVFVMQLFLRIFPTLHRKLSQLNEKFE